MGIFYVRSCMMLMSFMERGNVQRKSRWTVVGPSIVIVAMAINLMNPVLPLWLDVVLIGVIGAALVEINILYVRAVRQRGSKPSGQP